MKEFFKYLYRQMPFKHSIFKMLRHLRLPQSITRHLVFNADIALEVEGKRFLMRNKGYYLEQMFFWKGVSSWERYSSYLWRALAKRSTTILDVGANTGIYTLTAKVVNPAATIYAFEPVGKIYSLLQQNIKLNSYENVYAINKGISASRGKMQMYDAKGDDILYEASLEAEYVANLTYDKEKFVLREVEVDTVDNIKSELRIAKIDLVKIDVETHEPQVVAGMQTVLANDRPVMLVEILNKAVADKIQQQLKTGDYVFYNINEETGYERVSSLSPSSHFNYVICPVEKVPILQEAMDEVKSFIG